MGGPTDQDRIIASASRHGWSLRTMPDGRTFFFRKGKHTISVMFLADGSIRSAVVDFDTVRARKSAAVLEAMRSLT
jgi:hypothetical protein